MVHQCYLKNLPLFYSILLSHFPWCWSRRIIRNWIFFFLFFFICGLLSTDVLFFYFCYIGIYLISLYIVNILSLSCLACVLHTYTTFPPDQTSFNINDDSNTENPVAKRVLSCSVLAFHSTCNSVQHWHSTNSVLGWSERLFYLDTWESSNLSIIYFILIYLFTLLNTIFSKWLQTHFL